MRQRFGRLQRQADAGAVYFHMCERAAVRGRRLGALRAEINSKQNGRRRLSITVTPHRGQRRNGGWKRATIQSHDHPWHARCELVLGLITAAAERAASPVVS